MKNACEKLEDRWPNFQLETPKFLFDESDYYQEEMGAPLFRWWAYRNRLANPSDLTNWKKICTSLEETLAGPEGNRTVNLDPGYLNYGLVVLASHKHHHQKIFLGDGVYADPVLEYVNGSYRPFHWSFPDFQDERYYDLLEELRRRYKQLRNETYD
jgi:hypothetical protein